MRFVIGLCLLGACGEPIEIIRNGHYVREDLIAHSFQYLDDAHYSVFSETVSYLDLALDNGLTIEFVDPPLFNAGKKVRGVTYDENLIRIAYPQTDRWFVECIDLYYVLSHELMHYAADYGMYGNVTEEDNYNHTIPFVFVEGGFGAVEYQPNDTMEYKIYIQFKDTDCKE